MDIGVVREVKGNENRVALTPAGAASLIEAGHRVLIDTGAGVNAGYTDAAYAACGCQLVDTATAWNAALVVKVKEPQASEYAFLGGQMLFTYFHLAGVDPALTTALLASRTTAIAYETVRDVDGRLPLLAPMSAVAGNLAVTAGSYFLARFHGGKGVQLGTVLGEQHGKVTILGDGVVAHHAAAVALAMGARTLILGRHRERERTLKSQLAPALQFDLAEPATIAREILDTDLLVGAVLQPGARAPHLVSEAMVTTMEPGSVIVDVSIDQGGCIATSRPTTHADPIFRVHEVIHYCVTNMPGAYPRTSTLALTAATLPYIQRLADHGLAALHQDPDFAAGVSTCAGYITDAALAECLGQINRFRPFTELT